MLARILNCMCRGNDAPFRNSNHHIEWRRHSVLPTDAARF
jgi:hypothetical protein